MGWYGITDPQLIKNLELISQINNYTAMYNIKNLYTS